MPVNGFDKFIMPERKELFISKLKEYGFELFYKQDEDIEKGYITNLIYLNMFLINYFLTLLNIVIEKTIPLMRLMRL